jgi:hypothetical protein
MVARYGYRWPFDLIPGDPNPGGVVPGPMARPNSKHLAFSDFLISYLALAYL